MCAHVSPQYIVKRELCMRFHYKADFQNVADL